MSRRNAIVARDQKRGLLFVLDRHHQDATPAATHATHYLYPFHGYLPPSPPRSLPRHLRGLLLSSPTHAWQWGFVGFSRRESKSEEAFGRPPCPLTAQTSRFGSRGLTLSLCHCEGPHAFNEPSWPYSPRPFQRFGQGPGQSCKTARLWGCADAFARFFNTGTGLHDSREVEGRHA